MTNKVVEAIVSVECDAVIATTVTVNGSVYENNTVDTFDIINETHYVTYDSIVEMYTSKY